MYIRETLTRRAADKSYRSVRLVEGIRTRKKVQQRTLLNLGAGYPIPKEQWPELVEIIDGKAAGTPYAPERRVRKLPKP